MRAALAVNLLHHPASWKGSRVLRFCRRFVAVNLVHHRASSKGSRASENTDNDAKQNRSLPTDRKPVVNTNFSSA